MDEKVYGVVPAAAPFVPRPEILCHPNIPKPLHGIAPRVVMGSMWWDVQRQKALLATQHHCAACGVHLTMVLGQKRCLEAHEFYDYDYKKGRLTLKEIVALCPYCHSFIHSGLLEVLHGQGRITEETYEAIIKNGTDVLKKAGLMKRWEARHDNDCAVRWQDWRMVINGAEYGPSSRSMEDWLDGAWRTWKPPV